MKNLKIFAIGVFGVALFLTSCHKEKECECITTSTNTFSGTTDTDTDTSIFFTEEKCWEHDMKTSDSGDGWSYSSETVCEKK